MLKCFSSNRPTTKVHLFRADLLFHRFHYNCISGTVLFHFLPLKKYKTAYFKPILKYDVRCIFSLRGRREDERDKERKRERKEEGTVKEGLKQVENSMGVGVGGGFMMNFDFKEPILLWRSLRGLAQTEGERCVTVFYFGAPREQRTRAKQQLNAFCSADTQRRAAAFIHFEPAAKPDFRKSRSSSRTQSAPTHCLICGT